HFIFPIAREMLLLIPSIAIVLTFTVVAGKSETSTLPWEPRDCGDVYLRGDRVEGYYAIFPNASDPHEVALAYCDVNAGMVPRNTSVPKTSAKNCQDLQDTGMSESGINVIYPYADHPESPVVVLCEQSIMGGGWTVFLRRDDYDTQLNFHRSFDKYSLGFGNTGSEFWLGNEIIYELTQPSVNELYVELTSFAGVTKYALYSSFQIGPRYNIWNAGVGPVDSRPYQLSVSHYSGDAGDSMSYHNGMGFTSFDADNDLYDEGNCAAKEKCGGGWWYNRCYHTNPTGVYYDDWTKEADSVMNWGSFSNSKEALKKVQLMIRPLKQQ
ncbi:unnamed protein product, partial [Meganyctiphanes norvegica]